MDIFVLFVLSFIAVCVVTFILSIGGKKKYNTRVTKFNEEDGNLKYLQEIKRYEFWRDNGKQGPD